MVVRMRARLVFGQQLESEIRREQHRDQPRQDQRDAHDLEDRDRVFARARLRQAHRQEARGGDERAGEHRERGGRVGEGGRARAIPALLQLQRHHLHRDDRVVDQQAERDDQRAERDALQVDAQRIHHEER
jgi:hypothetical protein